MPRSGAKPTDARDRLLHVARRRFAVDGALAPTLDEVRREAEVSVGALYHHFPDKPALVAAVYAQLIGEYQAGFIAVLREHDTAEDGIRGGVAYHLQWVSEHRGEARLLLGDRPDSEALREANRGFFTAVRDWWRPHHTYGVLRPMRLGVTAALWLGAAQEYGRYWIAGSDAKMPQRGGRDLRDRRVGGLARQRYRGARAMNSMYRAIVAAGDDARCARTRPRRSSRRPSCGHARRIRPAQRAFRSAGAPIAAGAAMSSTPTPTSAASS